VLQFTVVTSSGAHLTASAHSHPDLFWALRGGGGGTYGIVTSVTYKSYPEMPLTSNLFSASITPNASSGYKKLVTEYIRLNPAISDAGWVGYGLFDGISFTLLGFGVGADQAQARALWDPYHAFAATLAEEGVQVNLAITTPYSSWYDWYKALPSVPAGYNTEVGSRLLPRSSIERDYERYGNLIVDRNFNVTWSIMAGAAAQVDPESTGLTPAWRSALVNLDFTEVWPEGAPISEIQRRRDNIKTRIRLVEEIAPGSGSYFNEASLYEDDPKRVFFGSHYDRLKVIKDRYDPLAMFVVAEGVGSDQWDVDLNCRV